MSHDSELLRRYAEEKSEGAFAELVERNVGLVYAAAIRQIGDADRAKDVVQSVFTDLARKATSLLRHPALLSWLFASTRYASRKVIRTEMRRRRREMEAHVMHELTASSADADWQRLRPVLDSAMCALRERERETILLRYFHGRSFADIGEALHLNESAARQCANRALDKLRSALARRGVESTSAALAFALANNVTASAPVGLSSVVSAAALTAAAVESGALLPALLSFMIGNKVIIGVGAIVLLSGIALMRGTRSDTPAREGGAGKHAELKSVHEKEHHSNETRTKSPTTQAIEGAQMADGTVIAKLCGFIQIAQEQLSNKLTVHEAQVLDRLYRNLLAERQKLEIGLAKSEAVNDSSVLITIPEYYSKGLELYVAFGDQVIAELGRARGKEIMQTLDSTMVEHLGGYAVHAIFVLDLL